MAFSLDGSTFTRQCVAADPLEKEGKHGNGSRFMVFENGAVTPERFLGRLTPREKLRRGKWARAVQRM